MPVVPTQEILRRAVDERYGVAAINVVNDLTMEAVLAAAEELRAPLIVQTSVKHVEITGVGVMYAMWTAMTKDLSVPVALHLDHCPDRAVISACLAAGWSSVLFDASKLTVEENKRQCIEVVAEARRYGAAVEGEIEGFKRTEEMTGDEAQHVQTLETVVDFVARDRRRRVRTGHRQRARDVQDRPDPRRPARDRHRMRRPASRWRCTAARG